MIINKNFLNKPDSLRKKNSTIDKPLAMQSKQEKKMIQIANIRMKEGVSLLISWTLNG